MLVNPDTLEMKNLITEWEMQEGKTADVYAAWFNYFLLTGRNSGLSISTAQPNGEALVLEDSTGNVAGYITGKDIYGKEETEKSIRVINEGINKYPDRLDLSFGKVRFLMTQYAYKEALEELHRVLDHSLKNGNKWLWTHNESIPTDGQTLLRNSLQDYFAELYNASEYTLAMELIDDVLKHYPRSIYFLNNKVALYYQKGDIKKALEISIKSHEIDPTDEIIISNIALLYKDIDKNKSKTYYKMLLKSKDPAIKEAAEAALNEEK